MGRQLFLYSRMRRAFSLVELSIVLVILGLLTGGILAGQSLIRAAELRSFNADYAKYKAAFFTFRDKYFALPGDMTNATQFWGIAASSGSDFTCWDTPSTDAKTCNGDGNGHIDSSYSPAVSNAGDWYYSHESLRAWQHLANAGLIEGSYGGSRGAGDSVGFVIGKNLPQGKISGASWIPYSVDDNFSNGGYLFPSHYGNTFEFSNVNFAGTSNLLDPQEAWNMDTKSDDGLPGSGMIKTIPGACAATAAAYTLSSTTKTGCRMYLDTGM